MINNLKYADDTILIAGSADDLQRLINSVVPIKLNCKKPQILVVNKNNNNNYHFTADNTIPLTVALHITYLVFQLNANWDHSQEIRRRIEKGFHQHQESLV